MNKPARGLRSDGEATRTRILEAAGELFATTGYAETPNKAIAALASLLPRPLLRAALRQAASRGPRGPASLGGE